MKMSNMDICYIFVSYCAVESIILKCVEIIWSAPAKRISPHLKKMIPDKF